MRWDESENNYLKTGQLLYSVLYLSYGNQPLI